MSNKISKELMIKFGKRLKKLNNKEINKSGKFFIYWMNSSQRESLNHSLEFSILLSNEYRKPLIVYFPITDRYKFSNLRYYTFMIEGILETKRLIEERGIKFVIEKVDDPVKAVLEHSKDACAIILDKGYLKYQRKQNQEISKLSEAAVFELESDVIVPIEEVSDHQEPYAISIRKKIFSKLEFFLEELPKIEPVIKSKDFEFKFSELNFQNPEDYTNLLKINKEVKPVSNFFKGGYSEARKKIEDFISKKLPYYKKDRSDPSKDCQSNLSPYLRFGQISPLEVVLKILKEYPLTDPNVQSFFNELIIWRELARNYAYYNPNYNRYEGIPYWAKETLENHKNDPRPYIYSLDELELAKTHDKYWNTAQKELLLKGKMHNYMRMYWCKKIIEWTKEPKEAFDIACYLNDKYELDGRDPNGYAGIAWCFGSFDRPFNERKIIGKIRPMNKEGLERKFDIDKYVKSIETIEKTID